MIGYYSSKAVDKISAMNKINPKFFLYLIYD